MRAYGFSEYGGIETQAFLDLPTPTPGPGQLLVAVRTAGVNPVDWKFRSGFLRDFAPLELPAVFGQEVSGVVEQLGPEIEGLSVGDEVFGLVATGGYSQYALVLSQTAALKPAEVSYVDAATLAVAAATAYDGIEQLRLGPTDTVLINGAGGGVGIVAAQLAKRSGATVIGTAGPEKEGLLSSIGVVHVPYGEGVEGRIREVAPNGVDALYDMVGGEGLRAVASLVTDPSRLITAADPMTAGEFGGTMVERANNRPVLEEVAKLAASGELKPFVTKVYSLEQAPEALALVEAGHSLGKIVIEIG